MGSLQHTRGKPAGYKTFCAALLPMLALSLVSRAADTPPPATPAPRTVVVFGDSLTAGHGLELGATKAWPAVLEEKLAADKRPVTVVNAGLSGETSAGGLRRIDWVLKRKADVFVLELGGNDGLRGIPPESTAKNLQAILDRVRAKYPDAKLVVAGMRMPPNAGAYAKAFDAVYPELAKKNDAALVPFLLDGIVDKPDLMQDDGIHPNVAGHRKMADNVLPVIEPVLDGSSEKSPKAAAK